MTALLIISIIVLAACIILCGIMTAFMISEDEEAAALFFFLAAIGLIFVLVSCSVAIGHDCPEQEAVKPQVIYIQAKTAEKTTPLPHMWTPPVEIIASPSPIEQRLMERNKESDAGTQ